jgi:hypothetical protein
MRIQALIPFRRPQLRRSLRITLSLTGAAALSLAAVACSGDGGDTTGSAQTAGGLATATANPQSTAKSPTPGPGTLTPLETPAPTSTASSSASPAASPTPGVVTMLDMAPCGDQTYYEQQRLPAGGYAITYKDVPEGTPILFPFKEGRLTQIDARQGAILLVYDVPGVGVLNVQAAGASSLDRTLSHVVAGSVIGHFGPTFGEDETDVFVGYQMYAVAGTNDLVVVNGVREVGVPLDLHVGDCLTLP